MLRSLTLCHQLLEHGQVPRHYQNKSPKELKEIPFLVHPLKFMYPTSFAFKVDSFFYQTQFYHTPGGSCCSQDEKQILRMIYMTSRDLSGPVCCFTLISDTYFLQISPVPTPQSRDISPHELWVQHTSAGSTHCRLYHYTSRDSYLGSPRNFKFHVCFDCFYQ